MDEHEWLAQRFDPHRTHLGAVAYRMLGSLSEADDAVQEAWLRLSRSDTSGVETLEPALTQPWSKRYRSRVESSGYSLLKAEISASQPTSLNHRFITVKSSPIALRN